MPLSIFRDIRRLKKRLEKLDSALKISFSKIKEDIVELQRRQDYLEGKPNLASIEPMQKEEAFGKRSVNSTERSVTVRRTPNTTILPNSRIPNTMGLTPLHLELLKRLMVLQMENNKRGISMRELASELYPNKEYDRIKSTLSEYVKKLHEAGLVEKLQKGRLYLSYTEKALQYADEVRLARMKEIISKPLQSVR